MLSLYFSSACVFQYVMTSPAIITEISCDPQICRASPPSMVLVMHYSDVTMSAIVSQITSVSIVCSTVCSGADQKASKLRITGFHKGNSPVNSPHKAPVTRKMFLFDDIIMGFSCLVSIIYFIGGTSDRYPTDGLTLPSRSCSSIRTRECWISTLQEICAVITPCYVVNLCVATQSIYSHPPMVRHLDIILVVLIPVKQPWTIIGK